MSVGRGVMLIGYVCYGVYRIQFESFAELRYLVGPIDLCSRTDVVGLICVQQDWLCVVEVRFVAELVYLVERTYRHIV